MIAQLPGMAAMEMPVSGTHAGARRTIRIESGEAGGTETVTVPGGTFDCEHYNECGRIGSMGERQGGADEGGEERGGSEGHASVGEDESQVKDAIRGR